MKANKYKILFIIFIIIICCLCFTLHSYGLSDFVYTLDANENATIKAYNGSDTDLTIPSTIDGHNVLTIFDHAFNEDHNSTNSNMIKNLVISEGITKIGLLAFAHCESLETVKLPESLTFLDMQAFLLCKNLRSVNIPSNLDAIRDSTFQETNIEEFNIPENVKIIATRALGSCKNLKKVRVYSDDIKYQEEVFFNNSPDLVLYGNENSTTQKYAQENGITFKLLSEEEEDIPIDSIILDKSSISLEVGTEATITATISPENATDRSLIWTSSDEDIVEVDNGKVTARSVGSAIITVSNVDGSVSSTCNVTVTNTTDNPTDNPITSISLNKSSISLNVGDEETLIATVSPDNATNKNLLWSSSNEDIVKVDNGKITAKSVGTAVVTASSIDGSVKATCDVNVISATKKENSDNTLSDEKLPNTGITSILIILMISLVTLIIIFFNRYKNLQNK